MLFKAHLVTISYIY